MAICAGNSPVPGEVSSQRPVTRSFDALFDLRLNKRLSKQSSGWWFETPSRPLWRHRNVPSENCRPRRLRRRRVDLVALKASEAYSIAALGRNYSAVQRLRMDSPPKWPVMWKALSCARPINGISMEFEIRPKLGMPWFKTCPITAKFCTHHESYTVVKYAKFRCGRSNMLWPKALPSFIEFGLDTII